MLLCHGNDGFLTDDLAGEVSSGADDGVVALFPVTGGQARGDARVHSEATIKDAAMTTNGEWTAEITNLDTTQYKVVGDSYYDVLHISTDIPLTMKNVKCTNVKVSVDDKQILELKEAFPNTQASDAQGSGNKGYYDFMIIDNYADSHGVEGKALRPIDKTTGKLNTEINAMPAKSLKITFTISGVDFVTAKKEVVGKSEIKNAAVYPVFFTFCANCRSTSCR